jgi:hypothetical protein
MPEQVGQDRKARMYNLLVGFGPDTALGGRMFEYTDQEVLDYIRPAPST